MFFSLCSAPGQPQLWLAKRGRGNDTTDAQDNSAQFRRSRYHDYLRLHAQRQQLWRSAKTTESSPKCLCGGDGIRIIGYDRIHLNSAKMLALGQSHR